MVEYLERLLQEKFGYKLGEFAYFELKGGRKNILPITVSIFVLALLLYILNISGAFENFIGLEIMIGLLILLVVVPIIYQRGGEYDTLIVTPKYIIHRTDKKEFSVIDFDKITSFDITKHGILLQDGESKVLVSILLYKEEVESIMEILEAKGKTFDREKDFMIRPIKIIIEENKIRIEDDETETETERLYKKYHTDFPQLTPGFIEEINFRNSAIEKVEVERDNLILFLSNFEVKGGHPENTKFENIMAQDCILIFEHVGFDMAVITDPNKVKKDRKVDLDIVKISKHLNKAVISSWKIKGKDVTMDFASGVNLLKTSFGFREVILGWKQEK